MDQGSVRFVAELSRRGVPIGVICHGGWILIEAGAVTGRQMTSYPSLRTDLQNAGARWVDEEVVNDHGLVSSRRPDRPPRVQRQDRRGVRRGSARAQGGLTHRRPRRRPDTHDGRRGRWPQTRPGRAAEWRAPPPASLAAGRKRPRRIPRGPKVLLRGGCRCGPAAGADGQAPRLTPSDPSETSSTLTVRSPQAYTAALATFWLRVYVGAACSLLRRTLGREEETRTRSAERSLSRSSSCSHHRSPAWRSPPVAATAARPMTRARQQSH